MGSFMEIVFFKMATVLIITTLLALLCYYLNYRLNYWTRRGVKQKTGIGKFIDNWKPVLRWKQTVMEMIEYFYGQFPNERYFGFYQFNKPILMLKDPDLIKEVLVRDFKYFPDHTSFENDEKDDSSLWTTSLFALTGDKWKKMRSIQNPIYTTNKLKSMFTSMEVSAGDFVTTLGKLDGERKKIDCLDFTKCYSIDVVALTVFGVRLKSLENRRDEIYRRMKDASDFSGFWISLKFFIFFTLPGVFKSLNLKIFDDDITTYFKTLLKHIIEQRGDNNNEYNDLLGQLMRIRDKNQAGEDMVITSDEITNSVLGTIIAGVNPLSNFLCFLFYELAVNGEVQRKLREEIRNCQEKDGKVMYEELMEMKYMEMVLMEGLRKWPTGITTDRVCLEPYDVSGDGNLQLPKEGVIWVPIFGLHRDPEYFPQPKEFIPERFSEERKREIRPYTYLPFGSGPRNCIGMRFTKMAIKVFLYYVLRDFEIYTVKDTKIPIETSRTGFLLSPGGKVWLGLRRI